MSAKMGSNRVVSIGNNKRAKIKFLQDAQHRARVHITGPDDRRFEYVVTDAHEVREAGVFEGQQRLHGVDEPDWMGDVLRSIGLEVEP